MTETSSLYTSYPLSQPPSVTAHAASPLPNGALIDPSVPDEEEYTIKCICIYNDDDGNTVYCEQCDTWQHILCYYLEKKKVPDIHFCVDCQPRDLDARKATERQRRVREQLEVGDRKAKKPSSKATKKKQKDIVTQEQTNGWAHHDRHDSIGNARDQPPPAKKPKTAHRASGSVASLNGESRKRAHSNLQSYPSPSKSPQDLYRFPFIPQYTAEFLELYDRDSGNTNAEGNEYTIPALNHLSRWKKDRNLVVEGVDRQPSMSSPFVYLQNGLQSLQLPSVSLDSHERPSMEIDGRHPAWRFLRLQEPVKKDTIVGEIRGEVGMLEEYCRQQSSPNRWSELSHPDPFVFFHPHMDIYVDSRKKGTRFRYLRRSCRPNVTLRTLVTDDGDAKHCFVAAQDIAAGSELTAAWFINPAMFDLHSDSADTEQAMSQRYDWISRVLANFGDCACGESGQCLWSHLDRRSSVKSSHPPTKQVAGRKRKVKSKQAISPLSTGQATNSRAGSEVVKGPDEDDQDDRRSTSGSTHSAPSRDLTPVNVAVLDADPVLGGTLTLREIRKIQAAEKAYEKEKQKASDEKKKKKRNSGHSTTNTPNLGHSKHFGHSSPSMDANQSSTSPPPARQYQDGNRAVPAKPNSIKRPIYASIGVQTDPEDCDFEMPLAKRVRYITPTQRLLNKIRANRERCMQAAKAVQSPHEDQIHRSSSRQDIEMKDAGVAMSPISSSSPLSPLGSYSNTAPRCLPLPSQAAHTQTNFKLPPQPKLHLSTLPPVPTFFGATSVTPGSASGNSLLSPPIAQSPQPIGSGSPSAPLQSSLISPSPVKKKMSLGDYMSSRRNLVTTPSSEKPPILGSGDTEREDVDRRLSANGSDGMSEETLTKASPTLADQMMQKGGLEGSAIDDTPIKDESDAEHVSPGKSQMQPAPVAVASASTDTRTDGTPNASKDVAGVLARLAQFHPPNEQATPLLATTDHTTS